MRRMTLGTAAAVALASAVLVCFWPGRLALAGEPEQAPAAQKKLNPDLLKLPENTWVRVSPDRNPAGRSYSGLAYGDGLIYYFGGGHGSYRGNDVELYSVAENKWTQCYEPEDWTKCDGWTHISDADKKTVKGIGGGWGVTILSPKGRPLTRHTYQMQCWFPEEKAFFASMDFLWAFDPAKKEWRKASDKTPRGRDIHTWNLAYDPDLKTIISIVTAGESGVYAFDREKKAWAKKCAAPVNVWNEVYSTYDTGRKVHVVFAGHKWWMLDLATGKTKAIADLANAVGEKDPPPPASVSLEYDPESKMTLAVTRGKTGANELWAYDADKDAWSKVEMKGDAPKGDASFDKLVYDPDHRCFLFLNVVGVQSGVLGGGKVDGLVAFRFVPAAKKEGR